MNQFIQFNKIAVVIVLSVFAFLILPFLFTRGMFLDGIVYACVSRNLSEGMGSFWQLHYTSTLYPAFYEHPPLSFFIQSIFFNILGDQAWTERLYSILAALINLLLIVQIWYALYKNTDKKYFWWIPVLFFIITPVVFWSFTNNMIENTLSIFTLSPFALALFASNSRGKKELFYAIFAGILTSAAFLTKGFSGLFPLLFPILIGLFKYNIRPKRIVINSITILVTVAAIIGMILLCSSAAREFFKNYFDMQVIKSINGEREITEEGRSYIIIRLLGELLPMIGIVFLLFIMKLKNNLRLYRENRKNRYYLYLFLCTGLSASLPLLASPKQHGYYLVPSLPFFALAFGIIAFPVIYRAFKGKHFKPILLKNIYLLSFALLITAVIYSLTNIGKYRRDEALLKDIEQIKSIVPENSTIGMPAELFEEWTLHAYMMRNAKISLDCDNYNHPYFLIKNDQHSAAPGGFVPVGLSLKTLELSKK